MPEQDKIVVVRRYLSRSLRDGTRHLVKKNTRTGQLSCTCPGWEHHKHCRHVVRVLESMGIATA